jgi:hypothetical protein
MFGRTVRLEPALGSKKEPGEFSRPRNDRNRKLSGGGGGRGGDYHKSDGFDEREFSTFRPGFTGIMAARQTVRLTQVNALAGRRMFGLAASLVLRRRVF